MWPYLATERQSLPLPQSNIKGSNRWDKRGLPVPPPFLWPFYCFPEQRNPTDNIYLISRGLYLKWCKSMRRRRRRRVTEGRGRDWLTEEVKAREVMREMEFAGSVWDRSALWSCKCVFCLHACACQDCIPATFGWLRGTKRVNLHVTIIPGSFPEICISELEFFMTESEHVQLQC